MAAGSTYAPIATTTLGSTQATVTFNSIPGTYTDLVLIINATSTANGNGVSAIFNGDTTASYSFNYMFGNGTPPAVAGRVTSGNYINFANIRSDQSISRINIQNYSNTTTCKPVVSRSSLPSQYDVTYAGQWLKTSAITSITLSIEGGSSFNAGSIFTLYGITAA